MLSEFAPLFTFCAATIVEKLIDKDSQPHSAATGKTMTKPHQTPDSSHRPNGLDHPPAAAFYRLASDPERTCRP